MKNVPGTSSHDSVSLETPEPENIVADESHENIPKGLFGKWRNQVDGRGLKGILGNFDL
jgi:hypothetical protein